MSVATQIKIRSYQKGDEKEISRVFEKCYADYSGYVERTPEFWLWFNLKRSGVTSEGVLVALDGDKVVGSLALAENGEILDPCYDPDYDGTAILKGLLERAETLACNRGLGKITINVPSDDPQMNEACRMLHMRHKQLQRTFGISITDHRGFLLLLLNSSDPPIGSFLVEILGKGGKTDSLILDVGEQGTSVRDEGSADVKIRIEEGTLGYLIFNGGMGIGDWIFRRITFSPIWKAVKVQRFLRSLRLGSKWFVPRGGHF